MPSNSFLIFRDKAEKIIDERGSTEVLEIFVRAHVYATLAVAEAIQNLADEIKYKR